jgi:hypothetical protein
VVSFDITVWQYGMCIVYCDCIVVMLYKSHNLPALDDENMKWLHNVVFYKHIHIAETFISEVNLLETVHGACHTWAGTAATMTLQYAITLEWLSYHWDPLKWFFHWNGFPISMSSSHWNAFPLKSLFHWNGFPIFYAHLIHHSDSSQFIVTSQD